MQFVQVCNLFAGVFLLLFDKDFALSEFLSLLVKLCLIKVDLGLILRLFVLRGSLKALCTSLQLFCFLQLKLVVLEMVKVHLELLLHCLSHGLFLTL